MKMPHHVVILAACLATGIGVGVMEAQEFRATLTGRVVDPSEAPVPEALVTVTNEATNVGHSTKTDAHGNYTVALLQPGSYSVTVTATGFKMERRTGFTLTVAETSNLDISGSSGNNESLLDGASNNAQQNDDGRIVMEEFSKDYGCTSYNLLIVNTAYNPRYTPYYEGSVRYQTIRMAEVSLNKTTQINERLKTCRPTPISGRYTSQRSVRPCRIIRARSSWVSSLFSENPDNHLLA